MRVAPLRLGKVAVDVILEAARAAEPREACGVVAAGVAYELPNRASSRHRFEVAPEDLARAVAAIGSWADVQAIWHSHPGLEASPYPSAADEEAHPMAKVMIIAAQGELYAYEAEA